MEVSEWALPADRGGRANRWRNQRSRPCAAIHPDQREPRKERAKTSIPTSAVSRCRPADRTGLRLPVPPGRSQARPKRRLICPASRAWASVLSQAQHERNQLRAQITRKRPIPASLSSRGADCHSLAARAGAADGRRRHPRHERSIRRCRHAHTRAARRRGRSHAVGALPRLATPLLEPHGRGGLPIPAPALAPGTSAPHWTLLPPCATLPPAWIMGETRMGRR